MTKAQENLLKNLLRNPDWVALLEGLKASREVKPFKPGGNSQEQHEKWVYESGILRGRLDVVSELGLGNI